MEGGGKETEKREFLPHDRVSLRERKRRSSIPNLPVQSLQVGCVKKARAPVVTEGFIRRQLQDGTHHAC